MLAIPAVPTVQIGTGVRDGVTRAEATQAAGILRVAGDAGFRINVAFVGTTGGAVDTAKLVVKNVTGRGISTPVPVVLSPADVTKLGDGLVYANVVQVDGANHVSSHTSTSFTIDTKPPAAPAVRLGAGVADGVTRGEASQAAGIVTVAGDAGNRISVVFVGTTKGAVDTAKLVVKDVSGKGNSTPVPVVLAAADVTKLGDGLVYMNVVQVDPAGNIGAVASASFMFDTVPPPVAILRLGAGIADNATRAEATQAAGIVTVAGDAGNRISVALVGTTKGVVDATKLVVKELKGTGAGTALPVVLTNAEVNKLGDGLAYVNVVQVDPAGNAGPVASASLTIDTTSAGQLPEPRPVLYERRGQYFSWSAPKGWTSTETTNGVDVASPDKSKGAGFVLLLRTSGSSTPDGLLDSLMRNAGVSTYTIESSNTLPSMASGYPGMPWAVREFLIRYRSPAGVDTRGYLAVAVVNYSFMGFNPLWDGMATYHAAPVTEWAKASQWLPVIGNSILITNSGKLAGNSSVIPPRNNPIENPLIESWRIKGLSEDRISEARRAGLMGYERLQSSSGQTFNVPLDSYVPGVGYYNPNDMNSTKPRGDWEILRPLTS